MICMNVLSWMSGLDEGRGFKWRSEEGGRWCTLPYIAYARMILHEPVVMDAELSPSGEVRAGAHYFRRFK